MENTKHLANRLAILLGWRETAMWYAGEPGPQRATARAFCDALAALIADLNDEIVARLASPAERRRAAARAERAASRAASPISWPYQQRARRAEYLADQREAARDRASAIARVWRSL